MGDNTINRHRFLLLSMYAFILNSALTASTICVMTHTRALGAVEIALEVKGGKNLIDSLRFQVSDALCQTAYLDEATLVC